VGVFAEITFAIFEDAFDEDILTSIRHKLGDYGDHFMIFRVNNEILTFLTGFTLTPLHGLAIGAGAGIENHKNLLRFNWGLDYHNSFMHLSGLFEYGVSGFWYKVMTLLKINHLIEAGIIAEHDIGIGPMVELHIPDTPFRLSIAGVVHKTKMGGLLSANINL